MSTFTIKLKDVIRVNNFPNVLRETFIGLDSYPIFDTAIVNGVPTSTYRAALNQKIIDHYYNREIGMEDIQMFAFAVRRRMNEYMPYANQLYKSTLIEIDPLKTIDIHTIGQTESEQESSHDGSTVTRSDSESKSRTVASDFPQNALSGSGDYATNATDSNGGGAVEGSGTENAADTAKVTAENDQHTSGYQGSPAELLMVARSAFMNIDMLVIDQLADCFMSVWSNGDEYAPPHAERYYY
jgi:hypothetical protein